MNQATDVCLQHAFSRLPLLRSIGSTIHLSSRLGEKRISLRLSYELPGAHHSKSCRASSGLLKPNPRTSTSSLTYPVSVADSPRFHAFRLAPNFPDDDYRSLIELSHFRPRSKSMGNSNSKLSQSYVTDEKEHGWNIMCDGKGTALAMKQGTGGEHVIQGEGHLMKEYATATGHDS
jgi:hypothetical protein